MNHKHSDPLDRALGSLPRDVQPERDLWSDIRAEISTPSAATRSASPRAAMRLWMSLAAGFLLIVASSVTTYVITQQAAQKKLLVAQQAAAAQLQQAPAVAVMPASFGGQEAMSAEYLRARQALDAEFQRQIKTLPPVTRAKLERNLADLRRAASEISATLAEHPNHALLQELLLSTYQSELALLGSVTNLSVPTLTSTPSETRL
ncbi:MAG TPA: hypothetical protein VKB34_19725 [Povalibacter sp.]|nr:hypothetical protein [Povalibacter sp.]